MIEPKRSQDLVFNAIIWVTDSSFALRKIDVFISKTANMNFVEKIYLVQEALPVPEERGYLQKIKLP